MLENLHKSLKNNKLLPPRKFGPEVLVSDVAQNDVNEVFRI